MKVKLAIIAMSLFMVVLWITWPFGNELVKPGLPSYNIEEIKTKMIYHGTLIAVRDTKTGEWYFYRHGEKYKLR